MKTNILNKMPPEEFWRKLSEIKNFDDTPSFHNICKLVKLAMTLPHSNAETERVFSVVNDVKTKKRNKLGSEALNAVSVIRYSLRNNNKSCVTFEV